MHACDNCIHHEGIKTAIENINKDVDRHNKDILDIYDKLNGNIRTTGKMEVMVENISKDVQKINDGMDKFKTEVKEDIKGFKKDIEKSIADLTTDINNINAKTEKASKKLTWAAIGLLLITNAIYVYFPKIMNAVFTWLAKIGA